jgi:hypothetical protein
MTRFGKILVLINVALSLGLAAWAVGVYTRHTEWSLDTNKSAPEIVLQVQRLQDRLKPAPPKPGFGLWDQLTASEEHWRRSSKGVLTFEPLRPRNQKWFQDQLAELEKTPNPVKRPSYKDGRPEVGQQAQDFGLPVMVEATDKAGGALKGLVPYQLEYADTQTRVKNAMDELTRWINEDRDLTEKIGGEKGLRVQIAQEVDKKVRVLTEQEYLKPLLVNSLVEGELLLKRRAPLVARGKELQGVGVAAAR